MEEGLKIKIGADITEVTTAITETEKDLKRFGFTIESVGGKGFPSLFDNVKRIRPAAADAEKAISRVRREVDGVGEASRRIRPDSSGFGKLGDSFDNTAKKAASAIPSLNALGQVARDLPFGFIAIQNNLPILFDQLGTLTKAAGGPIAAFKSFGAALIGPAGITFAIGAAFAAITGLVQKYGSVGKAIEALLNSNNALYKQQVLLNEVLAEAGKAAGTEIAKFQFLSRTVADANLSLTVRKDAIKELKAEYGAYLGNLSDEDLLNGKLVASTNLVVEALKNKALAQAAVAKAGELSGKVLENLEKEDKLTAAIIKKEGELLKIGSKRQVIGGSITGVPTESDPVEDTKRVIQSLRSQREEIRKNRRETEAQIDALFTRATEASRKAGDGLLDVSTAAQKALEAQREAEKATREAEAARKKAEQEQKALLQAKIKGYELEIQKVGQLTERYLALKKAIAVGKTELDLIGEANPVTVQQLKDNLKLTLNDIVDDFNSSRINAGTIDFTPILQLDRQEAARRFQALYSEMRDIGLEEAVKTQGTVKGKISIIPGPVAQESLDNLELMKNKVAELANGFGTFLAPAIDAAFAGLEQGQNVVQSLGNFFKRLTIQMAASVAKALVFAAILSAIGGGPAVGVSSGGFGAIFKSIFTKGLGGGSVVNTGGVGGGAFSFGGVAAPSIGNFSQAPINITLSGEFRQRGPDMVLAISETNKLITRVG